ncbi:hypothetical protein HYPSUDRAFT_661443 [Hypholoma sublateritium FD-334 SS-4]|uniref:Uncharacterized protein n=1 Tax=Hypholoma sublateritium (strain FD-334 SS-4) TaxID=945553 RepID=A0A0D2PQX5_HYPSF|nr:hypothetical protein HYPSUDRAFT_661443 [Hypholoma sublateritium FD-334 SS-4]
MLRFLTTISILSPHPLGQLPIIYPILSGPSTITSAPCLPFISQCTLQMSPFLLLLPPLYLETPILIDQIPQIKFIFHVSSITVMKYTRMQKKWSNDNVLLWR